MQRSCVYIPSQNAQQTSSCEVYIHVCVFPIQSQCITPCPLFPPLWAFDNVLCKYIESGCYRGFTQNYKKELCAQLRISGDRLHLYKLYNDMDIQMDSGKKSNKTGTFKQSLISSLFPNTVNIFLLSLASFLYSSQYNF